MEAVRKEGESQIGDYIVNMRKITFETDIQRLRKIREELCNLDLNKSVEPRETEEEESLMDEIRVLLDVIIEADSRSKASEKTFDAEETRRLYGKSF
jgi:hypothetical protein